MSDSRERFHLGMAKAAYLDGDVPVEEYEAAVEHVLCGGTLDNRGRIPRLTKQRTVELDTGNGGTVTAVLPYDAGPLPGRRISDPG